MDNYRPISVLPVVSKVLERVVHHQLHSFLREHKLLSPFQCGFRRNHSTEFAAIAFSDYIRRGIDLGLLTGSVFIDLRKAFDSVDHEILISKLESYGLKDIELDWFRNYLTDRKQLVSFGKEISSMSYYIGCPSRVNSWPFTLCPVQRQKLQLQLYSFTFNLQLRDSFHPRIGEPNRGGERDTQI